MRVSNLKSLFIVSINLTYIQIVSGRNQCDKCVIIGSVSHPSTYLITLFQYLGVVSDTMQVSPYLWCDVNIMFSARGWLADGTRIIFANSWSTRCRSSVLQIQIVWNITKKLSKNIYKKPPFCGHFLSHFKNSKI